MLKDVDEIRSIVHKMKTFNTEHNQVILQRDSKNIIVLSEYSKSENNFMVSLI